MITLLGSEPAPDRWGENDAYRLLAAYSVVIPALCFGRVPHDIALTGDGWRVSLVRAPGVFLGRCLLVDQGPVEDGPLATEVFNLSNQQVKVRKGDCISWLVRTA